MEKKHGLGSIYISASGHGPMKTGVTYPGFDKFSDEGGVASKGNLISFIEPDDAAYSQYDCFAPNTCLVPAGLSRVNQSVKAFVYCNVRSNIFGEGGCAKEVQSKFLVLTEGAIWL